MNAHEKNRIDGMARDEMARVWRHTPAGGWPFNDPTGETGLYFEERFKALGGMSPEISKSIGW